MNDYFVEEERNLTMDQNTLPVHLVVRLPSKLLLSLFVLENLDEP